jgi:hypothetical protein
MTHVITTTFKTALFTTCALALTACGDDPQPGTLAVSVWGEGFIEEGIPADELIDGWAIGFDAFVVSIGNTVGRAGEDGTDVGDPTFRLVDLAQPTAGAGHALVELADAPPGYYDHFGYELRAAPNPIAVNVDATTAAAMTAGGYSVWVRGQATKGAETRTFDWGFTTKLTFLHCDLGGDVDGNTLAARATIHADHLFYDDAVSDEPNVAFQLIADADGADGTTADGAITFAELAAVDLRGQARYQVGSLRDPAGAAIVNLAQYIVHQVTTVGHINGEGHCEDVVAQP